ncbi:class I SAM-dependent methyltransferase [Spirochaeta isovalerica]|uniref:Ubiquinone/menaquinone biosynthesis C-methylase UbiE n=1 Tax=Spirochaeta isovalerica TaxID=150 RepID=A0A841RDU5_9SPIO|nr:class I SAM-dependent methyltransferase [Spirochaeta isovalerica]MBB6481796.1 ubiquinone/menaquinone biosynthesis C-methylase UbiE [Spirochaeta isovalerica]
MKINNILTAIKQPELYSPGTATMWNDPYISKQLLPVHLDETLDLASRKPESIDQTVDWICSKAPGAGKEKLSILDLGCGPGLYAERFASMGHDVTAVDFSANSLDYAKKSAAEKGLKINYIRSNYLDLELKENVYDLIVMIYCDFGVLIPDDYRKLLKMIHKSLNSDGRFIFDVLNDRGFHKTSFPNSWDCTEKGFWKDSPYLALSHSFVYEEEKVILEQHVVFDDSERNRIYRFWTHYYDHGKLKQLLQQNGFTALSFHEDVFPEDSIRAEENVTFTIAEKN